MAPLCILIVDDFASWRKFVCSTLEERQHLHNIVEVSDGLEALQKAQELQPDLILLDIGLPTLNGLEVARQIEVLAPRSKIIFLTETHDSDVSEEAFRSGARGFVLKSSANEELLAAVDAVLAGKRFLSRRLRSAEGAFDSGQWAAD